MATPTTNKNPTPAMKDAAIRAVYELQYNSRKAARFVCDAEPTASFEDAMAVIAQIVRSSKSK